MATILESFVSNYLLNKLVTFMEKELLLIMGVKDELKKLENNMRHIGAYLKDAEQRRISDDSINNWLSELKDVMYDVDDLIDLWRCNNKLSSTGNPSSSINPPTCCPWINYLATIPMRREVAQQIKTMNGRLEEIFKNMANLNLQNIQGEVRESTIVDAHVIAPVIGVDIVGKEIEEGAKKLVNMAIMDNKQKVNLVTITGMGGIGKSTLAQKVYNNQTIQNKYAIRMWLHISQSYSSSELIMEAIRNAGGNPGQAKSESELLPILANVVSGKTFFLVLDDVWNPDLWVNLLQDPLKGNATLGFILVTTRDQTIAMQMGSNHIYQAKILSTKSGWELLCKRAYLTNNMDIKRLERVGVEIVKKCGGLPLAIKAIAGMLATKGKTNRAWEDVLSNNTWTMNGLPKQIDRALYLSYEDLSPQLKQCFLYCSLYPSNQGMYYRDIVEDWIAEGFIEPKEYKVMEANAEECYYELTRRHLLELEPSIVDYSQCRMHDLLRTLAQYLSAGESFREDRVSSSHTNSSRLRRLFITETNEALCIPGLAIEPSKLRTFQISKCLTEIESKIFCRFKNLRVLLLNEKGLHNIPESIGDLVHLRKLDLDRTNISNLPESIGSLTNLLFLNLSDCKLLHTLPKGITRLFNLRHLSLLNTPLTSVPKELGVLIELTEIRGIQGGDDSGHDEDQNGWDLQQLDGLSKLRRIHIVKLERAKCVSEVLTNKTHLIKLTLDFSEVVEMESRHMDELENEKGKEIVEKLRPPPCLETLRINNYRSKLLPSWMSSLVDFLPNLQYLILTNWSCCTDLPPLGLLADLKYLKIIGASSIVRINLEFLGIKVRNGPNLPTVFPNLEHLIFEDMPNWEEWTLCDFERKFFPSWQLMPQIKQLAIIKCPKLRALPNGLQQLSTIKELILRDTNRIKSLQDFQFECEILCVDQNQCMEILLNLPGVRTLKVYNTPNLRQVSKLDSVDYIRLENFEIQCLPTWLVTLMDERKRNSQCELHLELSCSTALLQRCLKGRPDWPIIKRFSSVSVHNEERNASLEYTKEPESYYASLFGTEIGNALSQESKIHHFIWIFWSFLILLCIFSIWCSVQE